MFTDSYKIRLVLRDENDLVWEENYEEMSLSDFEVLYGTITSELLYVEMKINDPEMDDPNYFSKRRWEDGQMEWFG